MAGKKKLQFSQLHVVFADALVFYVYTLSAFLSYMGKEPISDVAIAVITVYGAFATGGYFALSGVRDCSINRLSAQVHGSGGEEESAPQNG